MPSISNRRTRTMLARSLVIAAAVLAIAPSAALADVYVTVMGAGTVRVTKGSASNVVMTCESAATTPTGTRGADCQTGAGMFESIGVHVTPAPGYTFAGFLGTSSHCKGQTTTCWYVASGIASDFFYPTFVDTTAPMSWIDSGPASLTSSSDARFEFHADQDGSTFECRLDAGAWGACASGHTRSGLGDGDHTLAVRAIDPSGNVQSTPATRSWTVDRTPPGVRILSGPTAPVRERTTFSITYEPGARVECRSYAIGGVLDPWSNCTMSSIVAIAVHEGSQSFELRATDAAGNVSSVVRQVWVSDTTAPAITLLAGPVEGGTITTRSVDLAWSVHDANAVTHTCRVDDAPRECAGATIAATGLADGEHRVEVVVRDGAGNHSLVVRRFAVDATAPVATITDGPSGETTARDATFGVGVRAAEVGASLRCSLDGAPFSACSSPLVLRDLAVGVHELRVVARDALGTEQAPADAARRTWTIVAPAPQPNPAPQPTPTPETGNGNGQPGPVLDRTAPLVQVRAATRLSTRRRGTKLAVRVTCSEACTIQVTGSARVGRATAVRLAARPVRNAAATPATATIVVPESLRRALLAARPGATARTTITVVARDAAGNAARRTVVVTLTR